MTQIPDNELALLYRESSPQGKSILEKQYGKEKFINDMKITERVKSVGDAIEIAKPDQAEIELLSYNGTNDRMIGTKHALILFMLSEVLNEGKEADWDNDDERKWFPVWDMRSGFGFSGANYGTWAPYSDVGSRLCFRTRELAIHAAKIAPESYKYFMQKQHERK